jgi:hypothetical protein
VRLIQDPRYQTLLETKGSYMDKSELDITCDKTRPRLEYYRLNLMWS